MKGMVFGPHLSIQGYARRIFFSFFGTIFLSHGLWYLDFLAVDRSFLLQFISTCTTQSNQTCFNVLQVLVSSRLPSSTRYGAEAEPMGHIEVERGEAVN